MLVSTLLSPILLCSGLLSAPQEGVKQDEAKKPAADRSAEPMLKKIFEAGSKLNNVHVYIVRTVKDEEVGAMYPDSGREIWYESPSKFRFETFGYWGEGMRYIADGEKVIVDGLDGETPVVYRDLKSTIFESSVGLNQQGGEVSLLSFVLAGEAGMKELVKPDGFIKKAPVGPNEEAVTFESTKSGTVTFYYKSGGEPRIHRIAYDNKQYFQDLHNQYPDWVSEPVDPLTQEDIRWISVGKGLDKGLFRFPMRKGAVIDDQRTKKGSEWRSAVSYQLPAIRNA
ncbi:MAG: hypothetical protein KF784_08350 [Fimbriimonadaceae bacterium]|nr:hypothetical protein [Fimbriimonadaceae bacterium]